MFKRREFKNDTTHWIEQNKNTARIDQFLQLQTVGQAVDNFPAVVKDFLTSQSVENSEMKRIDVIAEWALTLKYNNKELDDKWRILQINRNAAAVLCAPVKDLHKIVFESENIRKIIRDFYTVPRADEQDKSEQLRKWAILTGHFQRIVAMLLYSAGSECHHLFDFEKLIAFCIDNIAFVACQTLLSQLAVEFRAVIQEKGSLFDLLMTPILKKAACYVLTVDELLREKPEEDLEQQQSFLNRTLTMTKGPAKKTSLSPPLAAWPEGKNRCLPEPDFEQRITDDSSISKRYEDKRRGKDCDFVGYRAKLNENMELSQSNAFYLLSVIRSMCNDDPSICLILRAKDGLRYLFICGVYSDSVSMVSTLAFGLLKDVAYGNDPKQWILYLDPNRDKDDDDEEFPRVNIPPYWDDAQFQDVLKEYAEIFRFDEQLTTQMIAAFPLFWNHRYEALDRDPEKSSFPTVQLSATESYTKPKGSTPLEYYAKFLFDEPPISDAFNRQIIGVFTWHANRAHDLRMPGPQDRPVADWEKQVNDMDKVILEFFRAPFQYGKDTTNLSGCCRAFPLVSWDPYWLEDKNAKDTVRCRVPLSGNSWQILRLKDIDAFLYGPDPDQTRCSELQWASPFNTPPLPPKELELIEKMKEQEKALFKFFDPEGVRHNPKAGERDAGDGMGETRFVMEEPTQQPSK